MKPEALFQELEELAGRLGLSIVVDRGNFKGGSCILEGEKLIVLNKSAPQEQRLSLLAQALASRNLQDLFIKPAVRAYLENYHDFKA
ncbi:MAG: hypothetical protein KAU50_02640 [Candidatus Marinimicrobia bacterium]|nr:hypothetical protein [Candidatus Neomarinimicrobiota bacterium]